jgi:hypothetical protein
MRQKKASNNIPNSCLGWVSHPHAGAGRTTIIGALLIILLTGLIGFGVGNLIAEVDKDERALAIEREEIERLAKDRDDELKILDRNAYGRLHDFLNGKVATGSRAAQRLTARSRKVLEDIPQCSGGALPWLKSIAELEAVGCSRRTKRLETFLDKSRSCSAAMNCRRRYEDGQSLCGG